MDGQEFKTVTDDGVWKRTVHLLNPNLPLILAKCGRGWLNVLQKVSHDGLWNWCSFLKDAGSYMRTPQFITTNMILDFFILTYF